MSHYVELAEALMDAVGIDRMLPIRRFVLTLTAGEGPMLELELLVKPLQGDNGKLRTLVGKYRIEKVGE